MDIALLNTRIVVQKAVVTADAIGNRKNDWVDFYTCYATVSGESGKEQDAVGTVVDHSDISFTIRYCRSAAAITSTGYRVLFQGELYNILAVDHQNFKRKSLKLRCKKEVRS